MHPHACLEISMGFHRQYIPPPARMLYLQDHTSLKAVLRTNSFLDTPKSIHILHNVDEERLNR
jgi:hypothetical protein